jgi:hypothetical protein
MKSVSLIAVIVAVLSATACESGDADLAAPVGSTVAVTAGTAPSIIPADVSYSIIDTDIIPGIKRSLDVRLNKKVSEDVLRAIALKLKSNDSQQYDRTFIVYYLPGTTIDAGAWATTHFDPTLVVRILGFTVQEEQALATEPAPTGRQVIGIWMDEPFGLQITIYLEGGTLYMGWKAKDGSGLEEELLEKPSPLGQRFETKGGSSFGDHWIIDPDGNLQILGSLGGLIATARRIQ